MNISPDFAKSPSASQYRGKKKKITPPKISPPFIELRGSRTRHLKAETSENTFKTDLGRFY